MSFYSREGCSWISKDRKFFTKDDNLVLIDWGLDKPDESIKNIIDRLPNHQVIMCADLEEEDLSKHVFSKISKLADANDSSICIIKSPNLYTIIKEIFEKNEYNILDCCSLKDARKLLSKNNLKDKQNNLNDFFKNATIEDNSEETPDNSFDNKREKKQSSKYKKDTEEKNNKEENNKEEKQKCLPDEKDILDELEEKIFKETKSSNFISRKQNAMSEAKASYLSTLFERTKTNIGKYIKPDIRENLSDDQFLNLIIIMVKTGDFEQFVQCWQIAGDSTFEININKEEFSFLYKEVVYYMDTCNLLYEQDKW